MKQSIPVLLLVFAVSAAASANSADEGYFATKADERAGRKTPGKPSVPPGALAPHTGTDACPGTAITVLPLTDTGNTTGATNDVPSIPAGCSDYTTTNGPDHVYAFTTPASNAVTFTLTPGSGWDPSIYVLGTCGTSATCVRGADSGLGGAPETIGPAPAYAAGTHALYVDSFYTTPSPLSAGPYTLTATGSLPVELIKFSIE